MPFSSESFICHLPYKNLNDKTYKTIILPVVLYGCETWITLRVLRIFGPNREEVTRG
jgi:hypothetical protein